MSELANFIEYILKRESGHECIGFRDKLQKYHKQYLDEKEQLERLKGCNQDCFYPCLNEEYIYPEPTHKAKVIENNDKTVRVVVVERYVQP